MGFWEGFLNGSNRHTFLLPILPSLLQPGLWTWWLELQQPAGIMRNESHSVGTTKQKDRCSRAIKPVLEFLNSDFLNVREINDLISHPCKSQTWLQTNTSMQNVCSRMSTAVLFLSLVYDDRMVKQIMVQSDSGRLNRHHKLRRSVFVKIYCGSEHNPILVNRTHMIEGEVGFIHIFTCLFFFLYNKHYFSNQKKMRKLSSPQNELISCLKNDVAFHIWTYTCSLQPLKIIPQL